MTSATITLPTPPLPLKAEARGLDFYYGDFKALKRVTMPVVVSVASMVIQTPLQPPQS